MLGDTLRTFLEEFEQAVRDDGDERFAQHIRRIQELPDPVVYLRELFVPRKRSQRPDDSCNQRKAWFSNYTSPEGHRLSETDIETLTSLTRGWAIDESRIDNLTIMAACWRQFPDIFWIGKRDHDLLRKVVSNYRHVKDVEPITRRITFIVACEEVQRRQKVSSPNRRRRTSKHDGNNSRPAFCLKISLRDLGCELWKDEDDIEIRDNVNCLGEMSLWGWKWLQLKNPGFILSLSDAKLAKFERGRRTRLQFNAIAAWIKTTPQFQIIGKLNECYHALVHWYRSATTQTTDCNESGDNAHLNSIDHELFFGQNETNTHENSIEVQEDIADLTSLETSRSGSSVTTPRADDGTTHVAHILTHMLSHRRNGNSTPRAVSPEERIPSLDQVSLVNRTEHLERQGITEPEPPQKRLCIDRNTFQTSNKSLVTSQDFPLSTWSEGPSPQVPHYHDGTCFLTSTGRLGAVQNSHQGLAQSVVTDLITQSPNEDNIVSVSNTEVLHQSCQAVTAPNISHSDASCYRAEGILNETYLEASQSNSAYTAPSRERALLAPTSATDSRTSHIAQASVSFEIDMPQDDFADFNLDSMVMGIYSDANIDFNLNGMLLHNDVSSSHPLATLGSGSEFADFNLDAMLNRPV